MSHHENETFVCQECEEVVSKDEVIAVPMNDGEETTEEKYICKECYQVTEGPKTDD